MDTPYDEFPALDQLLVPATYGMPKLRSKHTIKQLAKDSQIQNLSNLKNHLRMPISSEIPSQDQ